MKIVRTFAGEVLAVGLLLIVATSVLAAAPAGEVIPYERFTLGNGLRVIVHEDRKAPIVAVSVWYHVGSKDEPDGKTGFAHLFEHLMFRGSENFSGGFFDTLQNVGATGLNGTTSIDRTNYFETVPTPALELALWLESDRMGHLLGAVTQEALDDERGIVQNEKRQREGQPYGRSNVRMTEALFPEGHPYHHMTIGSMEDLNAASLDDVHDWFRKYYGAANAVVVLAGDIDMKTARPLVEKYFGDIPPGPPTHRLKSRVPERSRNSSELMYDNVAQTVIKRAWVTPGVLNKDRALLDIVASVLGNGRNSRLHEELVERRKLATSISASVISGELASIFELSVNVKSAVDNAEVEHALDEVVSAFVKGGPGAAELSRVVNSLDSRIIRDMESVSTKANLLAQGELYADDPGFFGVDIEWTRQATRDEVQRAAQEWLSVGYHQLIVSPFGTHTTAASRIDRSHVPEVENKLVLDLPEMQEAVLSNGIRLVLAERHEVATVEMAMIFENAGSNTGGMSDEKIRRGTADATFALMNDGPKGLNSTEFTAQKERLSARIRMGAGSDNAWSSLSALKKHLADSLELWADALLDPAFRNSDMDLWRESSLQNIRHGRNSPTGVAGRILSYLTYGPDHPNAARWNREEAVNSVEIADLTAFHASRVRPDNVTLFVVGDTTLVEITRQLEKVFGDWKAPKASLAAAKPIEDVPTGQKPRIILVDRPDSPQTTILAGSLVPSARHVDALTLAAANDALGGGITARISKNLRVQRGWSYGAGSGVQSSLSQRLWRIATSVQADKTTESVQEILKEVRALTGERPISAEELARFVQSQTLSLPGKFESAGAVLTSMAKNAEHGWPYDREESLKERLDALRLVDVNRVAQEYFKPETLAWVLVGDLAQFEQQIRDLNLGEVEIWSSEGKRVR